MSIFELLNVALRKIFPCLSMYQGSDTRQSATVEHIASGLVFSLIIGLLATSNPYAIFLNIPVALYYSVFKEIILDREKNKGMSDDFILAQIIERASGFVVGMAITAIALIF